LPIIDVRVLYVADRQVTRSTFLWSFIELVLGIGTVTLDFSYWGIRFSSISLLKSVAKYLFMCYPTLLKQELLLLLLLL